MQQEFQHPLFWGIGKLYKKIRNNSVGRTSSENIQSEITDLFEKIDFVLKTTPNEFMDEEEISRFKTELSTMYDKSDNFSLQLTFFLNHRKALTKILQAIADELDWNNFLLEYGRLFGFTMGVVTSIENRYLCGNLINNDILRCMLTTTAYFVPIYLMTSFAASLRTRYIVDRVINMLEEHIKFSKKIICSLWNNYFIEESRFAELFKGMIHDDVIRNLSKASTGMMNIEKIIFAAVLHSNPFLLFEKELLIKSFLFSNSEAAKEYYIRRTCYLFPVMKKKDIRFLEDKILYLKAAFCGINQSPEDIIFCLKPFNLPKIVLFGLHSLYTLKSAQKIKYKKKCIFSNELRMLASFWETRKGNIYLNNMCFKL